MRATERTTLLAVATLVAVALGVRGAVAFLDPDYYEPAAPVDYLAVWSFSVALLLLALAVLLIARSTRRTVAPNALGILAVTGLAIAGCANAAEDALGIDGAGSAYILAIVVGTLSVGALGVLLVFTGARAHGAVLLVTAVALLLIENGGLLVASPAWAVLAGASLLRPAAHAA